MKTDQNSPRFSARMLASLSAFAGMLVLAACASGTIDDAVPHAQGASAALGSQGTGQYPNLNLPVKGATAQFTPAEQTGNKSQLAAARQANESQPTPDPNAVNADSANLSKLGKTEPGDVLKQIESNQQ
jgi:hypothetical protein